MKRIICWFFLGTLIYAGPKDATAQPSPLWGDLKPGPYAVGFRVANRFDYARPLTEKYDMEHNLRDELRARPIQIAIWYPARASHVQKMDFGVYAHLTITERNIQNRVNSETNAESLQDFKKFLMGNLFAQQGPDEKIVELFNTKSAARRDAPKQIGKFPLFIFGQGNKDAIHRHAILAEYLASHGYVVATMPSAARLSDQGDIIEAQARDFEFVINYMNDFPNVDRDKLILGGFSLGGNSGGKVLMRNTDVDAFVSLDSGLGSSFGLGLKQLPEYLVARNRKIAILDIQKGGAVKNLEIIESFKYSDRYFVEMPHLRHFNFTSAAVLASRSPELVSNEQWIIGGQQARRGHDIMAQYVLNFLNAYIKGDDTSREFLNNGPEAHGFKPDVASVKFIKGISPGVPSEREFVALILEKGVATAKKVFSEAREANPDLILFQEGTLNNLGYRAFLNRNKPQDAIAVFKLVVDTYPESFNAYDSLAEGYMLAGDKKQAILNYNKSLELNPDNQNAVAKLQKLNGS